MLSNNEGKLIPRAVNRLPIPPLSSAKNMFICLKLSHVDAIEKKFSLFQELNDQRDHQADDGEGVHEAHGQDHHGTDLTESVGVTADSAHGGSADQAETDGSEATSYCVC